jgi:predicted TPR repeat methyltransferase
MGEGSLGEVGVVKDDWRERVRLPDLDADVPQDAEWCEILEDREWRRLRFHDYDRIFERPGLYEHLFYRMLQCRSPNEVVGLLETVRRGGEPKAISAIDLGAGNGIVGERLREGGAARVVGVDILPEAKLAATRDRPAVYDDYVVDDHTRPTDETRARLAAANADTLVCVAALGFGDIPPLAYYHATNFVPVGGHLAFNIKEEFLDERYTHGFSELVRRMIAETTVRDDATLRDRHRLSARGEPFIYTAMVATKLAPIPRALIVEP